MPATEYQRQVVTRLTEIIGNKPAYREFTQKPYLRVKWYVSHIWQTDSWDKVNHTLANYFLTNPNIIVSYGDGLQFKIPPTRDYKKPATRKQTPHQKHMVQLARQFWFEMDDDNPDFDRNYEEHKKGSMLLGPYSIGFKSDDLECDDVWLTFRSYEKKDTTEHTALMAFIDWCEDHDLKVEWVSDYKLVVSIPKM